MKANSTGHRTLKVFRSSEASNTGLGACPHEEQQVHIEKSKWSLIKPENTLVTIPKSLVALDNMIEATYLG